jgi:K+-sensing histidine kinase KdpD
MSLADPELHSAVYPADVGITNGMVATDVGLRNFFQLLHMELSSPLAKVGTLSQRIDDLRIAGLMPSTLAGEQAFHDLAEVSRQCVSFIDRLADLSDLLSGGPLLDDDRLDAKEVIANAVSQVAEIAFEKNVGLRIEHGKQLLAPVYGSQHWLGLVLARLVEALITSASSGNYILLTVRQAGLHQIFSGKTHYSRPSGSSQDLLSTFTQNSDGVTNAINRAQFDLALVQAVIKLHGGMFKSDATSGDRIQQFIFTLPTGQPPQERKRSQCSACLIRQQSLQYANDLAELMEREENASEKTKGRAS